jgi:hypothetical protein
MIRPIRPAALALLVASTLAAPLDAARGEQQGPGPDGLRARVREFDPDARPLKAIGKADADLRPRVKAILESPRPPGWATTGIDRRFYLDVMERILAEAAAWVDRDGRLIDPILKQEFAQSTPRFVSSAAILLRFGRLPALKEPAVRAMSYCCRTLADPAVKKLSPDFWMRELATALMAFEGVATPEQIRGWAADLAKVDPEKIYTYVSPDGKGIETLHNWAVYSSSGEFLREAAGVPSEGGFLRGKAFFEKYMKAQLGHFTELGMYRDPNDPITYDITTRLQVAAALAFGYDGELREPLGELLRRGGLATLLFVSPQGYVPYGGRSSQFCFQEAIVTALCELEARRYRAADPALAGAFKRQARLSARSVRRWIFDMTPWRHLKNGFPPEARHGIDRYGQYSVYSLLLSSFMGLAAIFADDTIEERPCPAELGGFVFEIQPAFHKLFANCGGTYLEIDTNADPHYDATGLGRFTRVGVPLELGPGMSFPARKENKSAMAKGQQAPPASVAIGPMAKIDGTWSSLASGGGRAAVRVEAESPLKVAFSVAYGPDWRTAYDLGEGSVRIGAEWTGSKTAQSTALVVPLLVTDGQSVSEIQEAKDEVRVRYLTSTFLIRFDPSLKATIEEDAYANRNGVYRSLILEKPGASIEATLLLQP